ncbi:MAG: antitoxin component YwqK of YwqJK toxin-antitoxin module [Glaciecola sp.]
MKHLIKHIYLLIILVFAMVSEVNAQDEFIEIRPRYRSKADKGHYNLRDLTGKRWGVWKIYNRSKVLISEIGYERGRKNGAYIKYNGATGKPTIVKNYIHGKLDGPYEKYTALGEMTIEGEYTNGKKSGTWTYSFPSGTVRKTGDYVDGLKNGPWEFYNRKEDLLKTVVYKNGIAEASAAEVEAAAASKAKADSTKTKKKKKKVVKKKTTN